MDFFNLTSIFHFFRNLIVGPILRFTGVSYQIRQITIFSPKRDDMISAVLLFIFGLSVKVLLADLIWKYAAPFLIDPLSVDKLSRLFVIFGYSSLIYFNFFGYSLMAMGLGRLFGFQFPENFRMPYNAPNPWIFWHRWHITLSYWVRDYLYFPLRGNRNYVLNILIVFTIFGLWHGAGWNFIVWGLYHAVLVLIFHFSRPVWDSMPSLI